MVKAESPTFAPGDVVLTKVKGFSEWPSRVVREEDVPEHILSQRKGKSTYCVRFFPAGDYAFVGARDLHPLSRREIDAFLAPSSKKRRNELYEGYRVALDPDAWEKSLATAAPASAPDAAPEPPAKKARADKKASPSATIEFGNLPYEERVKQALAWRSRLQRTFLKKNDEPATEDQMAEASRILKNILASKFSSKWIGDSKLNVVIKRIIKLENVDAFPNFAGLKIRDRAQAINDFWHSEDP